MNTAAIIKTTIKVRISTTIKAMIKTAITKINDSPNSLSYNALTANAPNIRLSIRLIILPIISPGNNKPKTKSMTNHTTLTIIAVLQESSHPFLSAHHRVITVLRINASTVTIIDEMSRYSIGIVGVAVPTCKNTKIYLFLFVIYGYSMNKQLRI